MLMEWFECAQAQVPVYYLLSHQEVALRVLEELVQLEDVRVIHLLKDADLSEELLSLLFFEVLFVDDFDSSERICLLRKALSHLTVGTYSGKNGQQTH